MLEHLICLFRLWPLRPLGPLVGPTQDYSSEASDTEDSAVGDLAEQEGEGRICGTVLPLLCLSADSARTSQPQGLMSLISDSPLQEGEASTFSPPSSCFPQCAHGRGPGQTPGDGLTQAPEAKQGCRSQAWDGC